MPLTVTQEMLDDARAAYHRLMTGAAIAEFRDQNGETIKYSATNKGALQAYIARLEAQLGQAVVPTGPIRVFF